MYDICPSRMQTSNLRNTVSKNHAFSPKKTNLKGKPKGDYAMAIVTSLSQIIYIIILKVIQQYFPGV